MGKLVKNGGRIVTGKKVLVTGMSGLIGVLFRKHAAATYTLSALNRGPVEGVECHQADIRDLAAIESAFHGKDVVVHLAALAKADATWEEALQFNVVGTYNVFEAARRAGVKRVILASSGATVTGWERELPYSAIVEGHYDQVPAMWPKVTHETPTRSAGLYGWSKIAGEAGKVLLRCVWDVDDLPPNWQSESGKPSHIAPCVLGVVQLPRHCADDRKMHRRT